MTIKLSMEDVPSLVKTLNEVVSNGALSVNDDSHRELLAAVMLNGARLDTANVLLTQMVALLTPGSKK